MFMDIHIQSKSLKASMEILPNKFRIVVMLEREQEG